MKRRILSTIIALALCLALLPAAALAAGETMPYISVSGTLVTAANQDDVLNDGGSVSVRYDETTAHWVIALNNAAITATGSSPGIYCGSSNLHYEVALTGENTISSVSRPGIDISSSDLTISGPGSLTATSTDGNCIGVSDGTSYVDGNRVSYGGNVIIDGVSELTLNGTNLAINITGALEIKNSTVTASNTEASNPVIKTYRDIAISNSIVSAKGTSEGVNAKNEGDITITNSGVTAESTWPAIYAGGGDISIADSSVMATSTASNGLYAEGGMEITGHSDVTSTGYYPALYTRDNSIDIEDSKVSAASTSDYGIYAGWNLTVRGTSEVTADGGIFAVETFAVEDGKVSATSEDGIAIMTMVGIEINGGEVYARSGADAAVAVWYEQLRTTDEAAARITLGENCDEISGGQIAFTEWEEEYLYGEEEDPSMMSWTSFIAANEENPLDYSLSNALSEVTIKIKGADYSKVNEALSKVPADLSEYTDESASELNRAISAVVYGLPYTQQDAVDGYAAAIEKALAELMKKPAPYVPPVVVPSVPAAPGTVPGEEDDGKEDGTVCDGGVSCPGSAFADLSAAAWYHEAVDFVLESGLMDGVGGGLFAPGDTMTRAMVWTVLGRMSGEDVEGGTPWYALAQSWAVADGVSDGTKPGSSITREQLVTMLYRQAGSPEVGVSELALLGRFTDGDAVSAWAEEAMAWAVSRGILTGDGGLLKPQASATRAQVAAILARFCETNEE